MAPERQLLLDLLAVRGYRLAAEMQLQVALIVEEFESDRRSRAFERFFARAVHFERVAQLVACGRTAFGAELIVTLASPPVLIGMPLEVDAPAPPRGVRSRS